jgi:hypothetical protein
MHQIFRQMSKCEASGWRFHSLPNMVMRGRSPVAGSGKDGARWILANILQIFSSIKHLIYIQYSVSKNLQTSPFAKVSEICV